MKKTLLAFAVLLMTANIIKAQDIQIDGKTFQTVKKTVLTSDIEYYRLKEKGKAVSGASSYIKSGGLLTKTIFNEAELKKFVLTGKVSSLGIVKEKKLNEKHKVTYVIKSNILVIINKTKNTIKLLEVHDKNLAKKFLGDYNKTVKSDNDEPGSGEEECPGDCCGGDCLCEWAGCTAENSAGCIYETEAQRQACIEGFANCLEQCTNEPTRKPGDAIILYAITLKGIAILMK